MVDSRLRYAQFTLPTHRGQNIWGLGPSHHLPSPSLPLEVGLLKYSYGPLAGGLGQCPLTAEIEFCALNCSFKI